MKKINVHVNGDEGEKIISVPCGTGSQTLKWLAHVGIARYDEREYMGWIALGVPEQLRREKGDELDLKATIQGTLENDEHVFVESSLFRGRGNGNGSGGSEQRVEDAKVANDEGKE